MNTITEKIIVNMHDLDFVTTQKHLHEVMTGEAEKFYNYNVNQYIYPDGVVVSSRTSNTGTKIFNIAKSFDYEEQQRVYWEEQERIYHEIISTVKIL